MSCDLLRLYRVRKFGRHDGSLGQTETCPLPTRQFANSTCDYAQMSRLLKLPSELLARTFSYVNCSSLKSLRKSCRFISQLATDQLYRTVHLQPSETSQKTLQEILNNPNLRRIPRKIYIDTVDESLVRLIDYLNPPPSNN